MHAFRRYVVWQVTRFLPLTKLFSVKAWLYRWCGVQISENVRISSTAQFLTGGKVIIGENTWVGHEVLLIGGAADIRIGANCDIGPRVSFVTGSHELSTTNGKAAGKGFSEAINVEDGVWIGASVTILGSVTVGAGSMVAAGSLVRENVPANTLVAGVPARVIRDLLKKNSE